MHSIEPHFGWRDRYVASDDRRSPFHGRVYDEFSFSHKIYNYFIHPQWDSFGSLTLYTKVLFVDYDQHFAMLEFIGEWNDCLYNDIMYLKREVIDLMIKEGIYKFALVCENVLNFHASDDAYYEEWWDDVKEENGWIIFLNTLDHVEDEMERERLQFYVNFGDSYQSFNWRILKPSAIPLALETLMDTQRKQLNY